MELTKKFEINDGKIFYREYKYEKVKEVELSIDDYNNRRTEMFLGLENINDEIDTLISKKNKLINDIRIFTEFDELLQEQSEEESVSDEEVLDNNEEETPISDEDNQ